MIDQQEPFWHALDELVASSEIVIDRPKGTPHPRYPEQRYPLDYGYLHGTTSGDGEGIDIWLGSLPEQAVTAILLTADLIKRDSEVKILLGCAAEEMEMLRERHMFGLQSALLIKRPV